MVFFITLIYYLFGAMVSCSVFSFSIYSVLWIRSMAPARLNLDSVYGPSSAQQSQKILRIKTLTWGLSWVTSHKFKPLSHLQSKNPFSYTLLCKCSTPLSCIFWPVYVCCALQMLVEISFYFYFKCVCKILM